MARKTPPPLMANAILNLYILFEPFPNLAILPFDLMLDLSKPIWGNSFDLA